MNNMILAMSRADHRLLVALIARRRPRLDRLMTFITRLGNGEVSVPAAALVASGIAPSLTQAGRLALWSIVTSHLGVQLLKARIRRERPQLPVGLGFLIEPEDRFSFPSGHATAGLSFALPFFLALGGPVAWAVLMVGLLIGVSRCYLGVHFPGDVMVGWALAVGGVASGWLVGLGL